MGEYNIIGGMKMYGEIDIYGAKNAVLPILAGTILVDGEVVLKNTPKISDIIVATEMLRSLGAKIYREEDSLIVNNKELVSNVVDEDLVMQMRCSIVFLGALVGRFKECKIGYPGGCELGSRPIDLHLKGLRALGVTIREEHGFIYAKAEELKGAEINLDFPSVGATENIILASVFAKGITTIYNGAKEPEIVDLQNFLNMCGAKVRGAGTNKIVIEGVEKLNKYNCYEVMSDRIVAGTYIVATAMTGGDVTVKNVDSEQIKPILSKIEEVGCKVTIYEKDKLINIKSQNRLKAFDKLITMPYPAFPTDMQSQMMALATILDGTSIIVETIFESRNKHIGELMKMGGNIILSNDGMTSIIKGVKGLQGTIVTAKDLRGGASLILAGLVAEGNTTVKNSHYVERGYANIEEDLSSLGCKIKKS
ncbi:MAG: UDP-N-acetylglucosamine 1-carboxyvinyltransferase [Lachnospirales bacterium]